MKRALAGLALVALAACAKSNAKTPVTAKGAIVVAIEGPCPKLRVWDTGKELGVVFGTYGLEGSGPIEARTRLATEQAFGFLRGATMEIAAPLYAGLPRNERGYVPADIELGGRFPEAAWLARVDTRLAKANQGALFERSRSYLVWEDGRWTESPAHSDVVLSGLRTPPLVEGTICTRLGEGVHFARHATERLASGVVITAGRCEDELQRAKSGVVVAVLASDNGAWQLAELPHSPMFDAIVNVDLVAAGQREVYLYVYTPYDETPRPAYLTRFDGRRWTPESVPFDGPIVSMARAADGTLFAIARFRELYARSPQGAWGRVALPSPRWADRAPPDMRIIEVQTTGDDVWVHAAYPIVVRDGAGEPKPSRSHVLYTTRRWEKTLFCDATSPAVQAVRATGKTLEVAKPARVVDTYKSPDL